MSRNFGIGTRDLAGAGQRFLQQSIQHKALSYSSVDALTDRWSQFAAYAKENGIGRLERITPELLQNYGRELAEKVQSKQISASYAQNLVSSVNTVMHLTPKQWGSVSPTKDCGIAERSLVRTEPVLTAREPLNAALQSLREAGDYRGASVAELARELGLRSKEAALLNAHAALKEAQTKGHITIANGTKGGRSREVPVLHEKQLQTLKNASAAQENARAVMPNDKNWAQYRNELQNVRETLKENGYAGLHDLRSAYAADRYEQLTQQPAPVNGGTITDRSTDYAARKQISTELGHGRIDVVSAYIGGR